MTLGCWILVSVIISRLMFINWFNLLLSFLFWGSPSWNGENIFIANFGISELYVSNGCVLSLDNVLHTPNATTNIILINKLYTNNFLVEFNRSGFCFNNLVFKEIKLKRPSSHGSYKVEGNVHSSVSSTSTLTKFHVSSDTCYRWLGHPSCDTVKSSLQRYDPTFSVCGSNSIQDKLCSTYQLTQSHKFLAFIGSHTRVNVYFDLLYLDLCTAPNNVISGESYFLSIVCDHSRFTWVFCLHCKDQSHYVFLLFKVWWKGNLM